MTSSVSWNVELTSSEGKKALLPKVCQPVDSESRESAVHRLLRDALDAKRSTEYPSGRWLRAKTRVV